MAKFKILGALILLALASGCASTGISTPTPDIPTPSPTPIATSTPILEPSPILPSFANVVEKVRPAVVYVSVEYEERGFFGTSKSTKTGSGALMSPEGYILTNNHVVENAITIQVSLPDIDEIYEAQIVGTDPVSDLAVIKIEGHDFPSVQFGNPSRLRIGDWVIALGNPLGLEGGPSITIGIVGNLERSFNIENSYFYDVIQTDAAINPGNSGGPLVDLECRVIGINTFILTDVQNIAFAIGTDTIKRVYEDLIAYGKVKRPYLGAGLTDVTPTIAAELNLFKTRGVVILSIDQNGPIAREGLEINDVITRFADQDVSEATELIKLLWKYEVNDRVKITFWREDQEQEIWVTLGERPEDA
ncbi:S1C family serine protease [Chloroflexota bacterium]